MLKMVIQLKYNWVKTAKLLMTIKVNIELLMIIKMKKNICEGKKIGDSNLREFDLLDLIRIFKENIKFFF